MEKPRIYLAHPMRGKLGNSGDGNYDYQNANSLIAIKNVRWLRENYPEVEFYCPGEVEIPVQMAAKLNYLTTEQILNLDLCVLEELCCGGLMHRWEDSVGVDGEFSRCMQLKYPVAMIEESPKIWECDQKVIQDLIKYVLEFHSSKSTN